MKNEAHDFLVENLNSSGFHIQPLAGDASTRRYYRIVVDESSLVLMEWEPFSSASEYPFLNVQRYFRNIGIRVPKVVAISPELGLVLLEDLGDLTLERRFQEIQNKELSLPHYKQALDQLIKIQYDATHQKGSCVAFDVEFDVEKLLWEMNYAKKHFLKNYGKVELDPSREAELDKAFLSICQGLHERPKRLCHRDYHSRNIMIKLNQACIIDFQDARMGPIQYDLVSLLRDSYVDIGNDLERSLLEYYVRQASTKDSNVSLNDDFFRVYELQTIQRCFKACGSFASFFNDRGDKRYLKYLPKTAETVKRSIQHFPEYKILADLIDEASI